MTVLCHTAFAGLPVTEAEVTDPVRAAHHRVIAGDQALVYEVVANRAADGGLSPATPGHDHSEAGNRLYWPVLYHCFGDQVATAHISSSAGYADDTWWRNQPAYITENMLTVTTSGLTVFVFPFFVPPAFAGRDYELAFRCNEHPGFTITLESPIGTEVGAAQTLFEDGGGVWSCVLTPPASGLYVVRVRTYMLHRSGDEYRRRIIYEMCLRPVADGALASLPRKPARPAANGVVVGNPEAANNWRPIDELLAADFMPTGTVQLLNAGNDTMLQERALGIPATGNATPTLGGHVHSGATAMGAEFAANVACWSLGCYAKDSTQIGGDGSIYDGFYGQGLIGPAVRNTTHRIVLVGVVRTPVSAHTSSATSRLKAAVVGYEHGSSKSGTNLSVRITTSDGATSTTRTLISAGAVDDYVLLQSAAGFGFASGGYTTVVVEVAETTATDAWSVGLSGVCLYLDP